jgi:hypothetical protein
MPAAEAEVPLTIWYLSGRAMITRNRGKPVSKALLLTRRQHSYRSQGAGSYKRADASIRCVRTRTGIIGLIGILPPIEWRRIIHPKKLRKHMPEAEKVAMMVGELHVY